jgi:predicted NBD/HSP70 family sugar kinase
VSVVNILSPDAIIFSGGISLQKELFVVPLITYIKTHAYSLSVDERLYITTSKLGENAPMIGAAFI